MSGKSLLHLAHGRRRWHVPPPVASDSAPEAKVPVQFKPRVSISDRSSASGSIDRHEPVAQQFLIRLQLPRTFQYRKQECKAGFNGSVKDQTCSRKRIQWPALRQTSPGRGRCEVQAPACGHVHVHPDGSVAAGQKAKGDRIERGPGQVSARSPGSRTGSVRPDTSPGPPGRLRFVAQSPLSGGQVDVLLTIEVKVGPPEVGRCYVHASQPRGGGRPHDDLKGLRFPRAA